MFGLYWIFMKHKIQGYFSTYCLPIRANNCGKYKQYVNCFLLRIFVTVQQLAPPAYYFLLWWLSNWHHQVSIIYFYDCPVDAIITFLCNTFCDYPTATIISFLYHTYFLWLPNGHNHQFSIPYFLWPPNWHNHQFSIPYLLFVTAQLTLSSVFYTILTFCDCPTDTIISFLYHTYFLWLPNWHYHQFSIPYFLWLPNWHYHQFSMRSGALE